MLIILEDERGAREDFIFDSASVLYCLLPDITEADWRCLRYVDRWGNTVFNNLQMTDLIDDLERLQSAADADSEKELLSQIIELARRCQSEVHMYIRFEGD